MFTLTLGMLKTFLCKYSTIYRVIILVYFSDIMCDIFCLYEMLDSLENIESTNKFLYLQCICAEAYSLL